MTDPIDIEALRKLERAATPGPWKKTDQYTDPVIERLKGALREILAIADQRYYADGGCYRKDEVAAIARRALEDGLAPSRVIQE